MCRPVGEPKSEEQTLRVTLPGTLYQRGSRWWWYVKLPGEDKPRSRPLKSNGARAAVSDRKAAEEIALALWEQTIRAQVTRQVELQNGEKLAMLKAQFLDRVHHFTQMVERATAKAEAEARARAEAEAKLAQFAADGAAEDTRPVATPEPPSPLPLNPVSFPEEASCLPPAARPEPPQPEVSAWEGPLTIENPETGCCECCNASRTPVTQLKRIDSGQWLCPRCLAALQSDAARISSDTFLERSR